MRTGRAGSERLLAAVAAAPRGATQTRSLHLSVDGASSWRKVASGTVATGTSSPSDPLGFTSTGTAYWVPDSRTVMTSSDAGADWALHRFPA
ncbi:MAG TPA: hypothetical protein VIA06_11070 [Candidatus Dormibacteraeota bacterium]|nr:hypothetical protein [Candidatus Dormibacteraeota bacterium]